MLTARIVRAGRPWAWGAVLASVAAASARADATGTAADIVPADCAAFSSTLRLREQYERFVASPAAQKHFIPLVKAAWAKAKEAAKDDPKAAQAFASLDMPQVQQGLAMAADLVGQEVFVYGDKACTDYLKKILDGFGNIQMQAIMKLATSGGKAKPDEIMGGALVDLALSIDQKLPGMVIGFKPANPEQFAQMMAGLAENAKNLPVPSEIAKVGGDSFVVVKLDGKMLPIKVDQFVEELDKAGIGEDKAKDLYEWLRKQTLHIALGMKSGYLVLSFGGDSSHLEKLGKNPLSGAEPFAPALRHIKGNKVLALGYSSLELNSLGVSSLEDQQNQVGALAGMLAFVAPKLSSPVGKELRSIVADMHAIAAPPSETVAVEILNRGVEGFRYTRGLQPLADYQRPLEILRHAGGEPILAAAWSSLPCASGYAKVAGYLGRFYGYGKSFAMEKLEGEPKAELQKIDKLLVPLCEELHAITEKKLLPAIDGGQGLFVFDAASKAQEFGPNKLPKPMPIPEMALAFSINDGDLLKDAAKDYAALAAKAYGQVMPLLKEKGHLEDAPEKLALVAPQSQEVAGAVQYFYKLPPGLDPAILPHVEVGKKFLAIGTSPALAERMRKPTEPALDGVVKLRDASASGGMFRPKTLYAAVGEWVDFAKSQPDFPADKLDAEGKKFLELGLGSVADLAACLKGCDMRTFKDGKYQVSHSWTHLDDGQ